jgi:CysZ protein
MIREFIDGVSSYFDAFAFIRRHRLWSYFILPGLIISLVLFALFFALIWFFSDNVGGWILGLLSWVPWDWFQQSLNAAAPVVGGIVVGGLGFILYKHLVIILMAPFMSPLSEKVEQKLRGPDYFSRGFSFRQIISDLVRGVRLGIRNIVRELFLVLLISILTFVPVINLVAGIAIFLIQAYYAGFGNMDYTLERYYGVRDSVSFVREHRGLALGSGTIFLLLITIPILGTLFAPPLATVAATKESLKWLDLEDHH